MFDTTTLTIIPPIVASIFGYILAMKRSKITQIKTITEIQTKAIELVQKAEEQMRSELRVDINRIRDENEALRKRIETLDTQRNVSDTLCVSLKDEIHKLRETLDIYKKIIDDNKVTMDSNEKEIGLLRDKLIDAYGDNNGSIKRSTKRKN